MKPLELMEQGRFLGEEFLLWLWMRSMTEGGASGEEGDGSGCFVDDAIQLASERGEVKEISLRKGNPAESREAFESLSRGMRPGEDEAPHPLRRPGMGIHPQRRHPGHGHPQAAAQHRQGTP